MYVCIYTYFDYVMPPQGFHTAMETAFQGQKTMKRQAHGGTGFELHPKVENINICQESQSHATAQSKIQMSPPKSILQVNFFALAIPTVGLG